MVPSGAIANDDGPSVAASSPADRPALVSPLPQGRNSTCLPVRSAPYGSAGSATRAIRDATYRWRASPAAPGSAAEADEPAVADRVKSTRPPDAALWAGPVRSNINPGSAVAEAVAVRT